MEAVNYFLMTWTSPYLLFLTAAGTFAGIYIGAIPGLSVTMAVSILISFTFKWHVNDALALISGIFLGGVYGGSRSAILLNIPGAPSAIATVLDGYPMAKRGEAGKAIGLTTVISVFGGFIGILVLAVAAPAVANLALKFAPRDYLLLAIWGILLVGSLSGGSLAKGIFAGALGVEMVTGEYMSRTEDKLSITYIFLSHTEELLEMLGLVVLLRALFEYAGSRIPHDQVKGIAT